MRPMVALKIAVAALKNDKCKNVLIRQRPVDLTRGTYIEAVTCPTLERGVTSEVTAPVGDPGIYSIYD